jgi:hypothetical protein
VEDLNGTYSPRSSSFAAAAPSAAASFSYFCFMSSSFCKILAQLNTPRVYALQPAHVGSSLHRVKARASQKDSNQATKQGQGLPHLEQSSWSLSIEALGLGRTGHLGKHTS